MTFVVPGLTWQDDVTQQVISRELAKLSSTPLHRQATPPGPHAAYGGSRVRKLRPGKAELNGNLQQYLSSLGFFRQPDVGGQLGVQRQEASIQVKISYVRVFLELAYLMWFLHGSSARPPPIMPISRLPSPLYISPPLPNAGRRLLASIMPS